MAETKLSRDAQRTKHEGAIEKQIIADNDEIFRLFTDRILRGRQKKIYNELRNKTVQTNEPFLLYTFRGFKESFYKCKQKQNALFCFELCDCEVMKCE